MTVQIAHLSDFHLTEGVDLEEQRAILGACLREIARLGVHLVALTGDFYGHTVPHKSSPAERDLLFWFVSALASMAPVVVLYGNHDYPLDLEPLGELGGELGHPVVVVKGAEHRIVQTTVGPVQVFAMAYPSKRWLLAGQPSMGAERSRVAVGEVLEGLLDLWRVQRDRSLPGLFLGHCTVRGARLAGGEVLAGNEIEVSKEALQSLGVDYAGLGHIHLRQELFPGGWYVGSLWRNSFAETESKGWHLVSLAGPETTVDFRETHPRARVTLDYRWASKAETEEPGWLNYPTELSLALVRDAHVRARLIVPQQWAATCPWDEELAKLEELGAHRIKIERRVEPVLRSRAPEITRSETLPEKLEALWGTFATPLDQAEKAAALAALGELQTNDDEQIAATTQAMLNQAAG